MLDYIKLIVNINFAYFLLRLTVVTIKFYKLCIWKGHILYFKWTALVELRGLRGTGMSSKNPQLETSGSWHGFL